MKTLLSLLIIISGCGQAPTAKELATAVAQSSASKTATTSSNVEAAPSQATGPEMDFNRRPAQNYAAATNTCQAVGRTLCTVTQYQTAYTNGQLYYTYTDNGDYWTQPYIDATNAHRNTFHAWHGGIMYTTTTVTNPQEFYCCRL